MDTRKLSMADSEDLGAKNIPVLTVLKNNVVLKNIVVNQPPTACLKSIDRVEIEKSLNLDGGEEFLVGRHPDCNIVLEHPSISRLHLRVRVYRNLKKLFVLDLSSVHGTWISDKKIKPDVLVELTEDDTLRLGGSSRIYRLRWIPLSGACDLETSFVPDEFLRKENEDETTVSEEESENETIQVKNSFPVEFYPSEVHKIVQDSMIPCDNHHHADTSDALPRKPQTGSDTEVPPEKEDECMNAIDDADNSKALVQESEMKKNEHECGNSSFPEPIIWSGRGKPATFLHLETGFAASSSIRGSSSLKHEALSKSLFHAMDEDDEAFTPDKENLTPNTYMIRSMKNDCKLESVSKSLFNGKEEEEAFTPDKENLTPNPKKSCQLERLPRPKKPGSFISSQKENQKPSKLGLTSRSKEGGERIPFQSLLVNSAGKLERSVSVIRQRKMRISPSKTNSEASVCFPPANNTSANPGMEKKSNWYIVVDSACLLKKESRKCLQLLQGLIRTQLIIPRIVVRELDCLKRRGRLFRSGSEACSALQWIEECLVSTNWWIHVQSSLEESRNVGVTPPDSPRSDGNAGGLVKGSGTVSFVAFSHWGSFVDIVSPTAEDHVLNCALYFKRVKKDGQVVLLSDDVALKIKAMAEGLICETAEVFRESLVNPLSKRFLWADSSPRGLTWSCLDDVVSRDKIWPTSMKSLKTTEAPKGLKLIVVHKYK